MFFIIALRINLKRIITKEEEERERLVKGQSLAIDDLHFHQRFRSGVSSSDRCKGHILKKKELAARKGEEMSPRATIGAKTVALTIISSVIYNILMLTRAACLRPLIYIMPEDLLLVHGVHFQSDK